MLDRNLFSLRDLIDRSLADVRLSAGRELPKEPIVLSELLEDLQVSAALEAKARGIGFSVSAVDKALIVDADRQLLSSAISNLLQNAFKFSRPHGQVTLTARADADCIVIDVEDECGGLPAGKPEELFKPFEQHGSNRTGLGLGLSISRRAVEANSGTLSVRDLPGKGCVFTIHLPRSSLG